MTTKQETLEKETLQKRLEDLQTQWNKGQEILQGHQKEIQTIQANILRIEGAMILVKEFLAKENPKA